MRIINKKISFLFTFMILTSYIQADDSWVDLGDLGNNPACAAGAFPLGSCHPSNTGPEKSRKDLGSQTYCAL